MKIEDELKRGVQEYLESARDDENKGRKRSAATMYFKAMAAVCDYVIYSKIKKLPDNHTERFRMMETGFQAFYTTLSKTFPIYQQTYRADISKEQLEMLKYAFKKISKLAGLE